MSLVVRKGEAEQLSGLTWSVRIEPGSAKLENGEAEAWDGGTDPGTAEAVPPKH
ncbi:MAG TPA: hypothetical protein VF782_14750 [Allosphingosinicella sp.]|jgi:hypothetical protein